MLLAVTSFVAGIAVSSIIVTIGLAIAFVKLIKEVKKDDIYANNSVGNSTKRDQ